MDKQPYKESASSDYVTLLSANAVVALSDEEVRRRNVIPMAVAARAEDDSMRKCDTFTTTVHMPPSPYTLPNTDAINRQLTEQGTRHGRRHASDEVAVLARTNRTVIPAVNNMHHMHVDAANQKAAVRQYLEETGQTQTSWTPPQPPRVPPPTYAAHAPNDNVLGTYGSDYETSEYTTGEYTTSDYETTPYKSVYE